MCIIHLTKTAVQSKEVDSLYKPFLSYRDNENTVVMSQIIQIMIYCYYLITINKWLIIINITVNNNYYCYTLGVYTTN